MAESGTRDDDVILTKADIAAMTVDELRFELKQRGRLISELSKTQLQGVLLQTLGQKTATMTTRSASQAEASALPTAQPRPPAEPEESDEGANLDSDADQLPVQQDAPPTQNAPKEYEPYSGLGARPKVYTEEYRQPEVIVAGRTSTVGASVRATTKVADPSSEPSELQLRRMYMEFEIHRMELEERERERQYQRERERQREEREERERDRQHQLELRRLELEVGLAGAEPSRHKVVHLRSA